jgi:hypothetical protein
VYIDRVFHRVGLILIGRKASEVEAWGLRFFLNRYTTIRNTARVCGWSFWTILMKTVSLHVSKVSTFSDRLAVH